jgi:hypothetical protein
MRDVWIYIETRIQCFKFQTQFNHTKKGPTTPRFRILPSYDPFTHLFIRHASRIWLLQTQPPLRSPPAQNFHPAPHRLYIDIALTRPAAYRYLSQFLASIRQRSKSCC